MRFDVKITDISPSLNLLLLNWCFASPSSYEDIADKQKQEPGALSLFNINYQIFFRCSIDSIDSCTHHHDFDKLVSTTGFEPMTL